MNPLLLSVERVRSLSNVIKMGRTQLQDAVPMTSGQEFNAFANTLEEEIANLNRNAASCMKSIWVVLAIGTGLERCSWLPKDLS